MTCIDYDPWKKQKHPLNMEECFHFVPQLEKCGCATCKQFNEKCVFEDGTPDEKKANT